MVTTESAKQIVKNLVDAIVAGGIPVHRAYLFGSVASGKNHEYSDIDVAIVSEKFVGIPFDDRRTLNPYVLQIDSSLELHPFSISDFSDDNPFVNEIKQTGLIVC
jgi:predicted nucleotidyltransferase